MVRFTYFLFPLFLLSSCSENNAAEEIQKLKSELSAKEERINQLKEKNDELRETINRLASEKQALKQKLDNSNGNFEDEIIRKQNSIIRSN